MTSRHRRHRPSRRHARPPEVIMSPEEVAARAEYTAALQAWIAARGLDEPAARERLTRARAHIATITNQQGEHP